MSLHFIHLAKGPEAGASPTVPPEAVMLTTPGATSDDKVTAKMILRLVARFTNMV